MGRDIDFVPEYFMKRLRLRFDAPESVFHFPDDGFDKEAELKKSLQVLKVMKNMIKLYSYHNTVVPFGQYESPKLYQAVERFALDTFKQNQDLN